MVYGIYNYSYWGFCKPTNITGGAHIAWLATISKSIQKNRLPVWLDLAEFLWTWEVI